MKPKNKKILNETDTREKLFSTARLIGCVSELKEILKKYDALIRTCGNEQERKDIAALGAFEIHSLFGKGKGTLEVDGKIVYSNLEDIK